MSWDVASLCRRRWSPSQTHRGLVRSWTKNQRHRVQAIWLILGANSACSICVSDAWWGFWILDTQQMFTRWSVPQSCAEGFVWRLPASHGLPCHALATLHAWFRGAVSLKHGTGLCSAPELCQHLSSYPSTALWGLLWEKFTPAQPDPMYSTTDNVKAVKRVIGRAAAWEQAGYSEG